jgi:hypothetical protein
MRKFYGFSSHKILEIALLHALGKLPEPKFAHEFRWRDNNFQRQVVIQAGATTTVPCLTQP